MFHWRLFYKIMKPVSFLLILLIGVRFCDTANILVICPYSEKSHFWIFEPLFKELAFRKHNVTVISEFPQNSPITNYRDVNIANDSASASSWNKLNLAVYSKFQTWLCLPLILEFSGITCDIVLSHQNLQNFLTENNEFDVILYDPFVTNCFLGIAKKIGAPILGKSIY